MRLTNSSKLIALRPVARVSASLHHWADLPYEH